jgi:branched-chain amino acid transport system ATP-binding protein
MIEGRGIHTCIGSSTVLHGIDFKVSSGEMLAVLGANGAGKTTLLRTVSNLLVAEEGEIVFNGASTIGRRAHELARQGLIHVPQGRQIVPRLSVRDNMLLGARRGLANSMPVDELMEREFTRFPILRKRQTVMGGALSGGEQQMLAVSRALMMRPKALMLDEPSLGLAPQIVRLILASLRELAHGGLAVILVEQVATLALEHCDHAMILRNGTCVLSGKASSLRGSQAVVDSYLS